MASQERQSLSVSRGLCGAVIAALAVAIVPLAIPLGLYAIGHDTTRDLGYDLREDPAWLADPIMGCAAIFAFTGWATFAPAGKHSFARTLAIVFLVSACVWSTIALCGIAPRHYKGMTASEWYPRAAALVLLPPMIAAAVVTWMCVRVASQQNAEPIAVSDGGRA